MRDSSIFYTYKSMRGVSSSHPWSNQSSKFILVFMLNKIYMTKGYLYSKTWTYEKLIQMVRWPYIPVKYLLIFFILMVGFVGNIAEDFFLPTWLGERHCRLQHASILESPFCGCRWVLQVIMQIVIVTMKQRKGNKNKTK